MMLFLTPLKNEVDETEGHMRVQNKFNSMVGLPQK